MPQKNAGELWIDYQSLTDLYGRMWAENPKAHDIEGIKTSMTRYRFNAPVGINERTGLLVFGHGRITALMELKRMNAEAPGNITVRADGEWFVPVIRGLAFATDAEVEEYVVADNALTIAEGWDDPKLGAIIKRMADRRVPLSSLGWKRATISGILRKLRPPREVPLPTDAPEVLAKKWGVIVGQVWEIPSATRPGQYHRVRCGDSKDTEAVKRLCSSKIDTVFTDPPYGVNYTSRVDLERRKGWGEIANDNLTPEQLVEFLRATVPADIQYRFVCCSWDSYPAFWQALGKPNACNVWVKNYFGLGKGYRRKHEFVLFYGKLDRTDLDDVWPFDRETEYMHPTQKPIPLVTKALADVDAQAVYDPFLGSGTTLFAAEQVGAICYGCELTPGYTAVVLERASMVQLAPRLVEAASAPVPSSAGA